MTDPYAPAPQMRIYMLGTCDTCRKALRELRNAGHAPVIVDVRADGIARERIARFHADLGDAIVNRRSRIWRDLDPAERSGDPVDLIAAHPTLMKRPVIDDGARLHLGWSDAVQRALL